MKKKWKLYYAFSFVFLVLLSLSFLYLVRISITGFAVYPGSGGCGSTFPSGSHSFSSSIDCDSSFLGTAAYIISSDNTQIDCAGFTISGDNTNNDDTFEINGVSSEIIIGNCTLNNGNNNLYFTNSQNVIIRDSTLAIPVTNDLNLATSYNITLINVSFSGSASIGVGSNYTRQWYLDVQVNWSNGTGLGGANVIAFNDSINANFSYIADSIGFVRIPVTQYIETNGGPTYYSFYNVSATGSGTNSTTIVIDSNKLGSSGVQLNIEIPDTTNPSITLNSPADEGNDTDGSVLFNATASDGLGLANVSLMGNWSGGWHLNETNSSPLNNSFHIFSKTLDDGYYIWNVEACDDAGNCAFDSANRSLTIDSTSPNVTINSPTATTYSTSSYDINISINENGYCEFSLDSGSTNETLTTTDNLTFTSSKSSISNGDYTLNAYCNDSYNNRNDSVSVTFTISASSSNGGSSGGGGSSCNVKTWDCGNWSECADKNQTRICISNCGAKKNESRTCNNSGVENIEKKISAKEMPQQNEAVKSGWRDLISTQKTIITITGIAAATAIIGGLIWTWMWLLTLIIPFFLLRLRHYIIAIIDGDNKFDFLGQKEKIDSEELEKFLISLKKKTGKLIYAGKKDKTLRFLLERGFLEIQLNRPVVLNAHFSKRKDAKQFKKALIGVINSRIPKDERDYLIKQIIEVVERKSIFSLIREIMRTRKTQKEIRKMKK